jgi:diguanylate cyclase (GGDEF)-like protein
MPGSTPADFKGQNTEQSLKRIIRFLPWAIGLAVVFYAILWILPLPRPDGLPPRMEGRPVPPHGFFPMGPPRFAPSDIRRFDRTAVLFFVVWGGLAWLACKGALASGKGRRTTLIAVHLLLLAQSAIVAILENIDGVGLFGIALGCFVVPGFLTISPKSFRITTILFLAGVVVPLRLLIDDPAHYVIFTSKALALALLSAILQYHFHKTRLELHQIVQDLHEHNTRLSLSASSDPLTGLANRRAFEQAFDVEWERWRHDGRTFSLVTVDIDFFKKINDTMGHDFGDSVLKEVGRHLGSAIRQSDLVVRMGGEEFLLLLPGAGTDRALAIAERLHTGLADLETGRSYGIPITASFGVAGAGETGTPEEFLRLADQRLYAAKRGGRDRVVGPETLPG